MAKLTFKKIGDRRSLPVLALVIIFIMITSTTVLAQSWPNPGHPASQVGGGTFNNSYGDFIFMNNVSMEDSVTIGSASINLGEKLSVGDGTNTAGIVVNASTYGIYSITDSSGNGGAVGGVIKQSGTGNSIVEGNLALKDDGGSGWVSVFGYDSTNSVEAFLANGTVAVYGKQASGDYAGLFDGNVSSNTDFCISGGNCLSTVGSGTVTGTGSANYLTKWTGTSSVGSSVIYQSLASNFIGIGTADPDSKLHVDGGTIIANNSAKTSLSNIYAQKIGMIGAVDGNASAGVIGIINDSIIGILGYNTSDNEYSPIVDQAGVYGTSIQYGVFGFGLEAGVSGWGADLTAGYLGYNDGSWTAGVYGNDGWDGDYAGYFDGNVTVNAGVLNVTGNISSNTDVCIRGGNCLSTVGGGSGSITGSGNVGNISMFVTNSTNIGSSVIYQSGTSIGIGTSSPGAKLEVVDSGGSITIGDASNNAGIRDVSTHTYQYMTSDTSAVFNIWSSGRDTSLSIQNSDGSYTADLAVEGNISAGEDVCISGGNCLSNVGSGTIGGSGSTNTIPKFTTASTIGNSAITESTTTIDIHRNLTLGAAGYIDDDTTFGDNSDDWIRLNDFVEVKSNTDSYGLVIRDKDNNQYASITQIDAASYLTDTNSALNNYFIKGDGRNVSIGGNLTVDDDMFVDSTAGEVGIGTTGPVAQTEIYGTGQTTAALTNAGSRGGMLILSTDSSAAGNGGALVFGNSQSHAANSIGFAAIKGLLADGSSNTAGDIAFSTRNAAADTALTERMRISYSGNVGIGTPNPSAKLQVNGTVGFGSFTDSSSSGMTVSYTDGGTGTTNFTGNRWGADWYWRHDSASGDLNQMFLSSSDNSLRLYNGTSSPTGSATKVQLNPNGISYFTGGNVGIGTTSPTSTLSVGGAGVANTGIYGTGSTHGIYGSNSGSGTYGTLGSSAYGVSGYYNSSVWGYIGGDSVGVMGRTHSTNYGQLGKQSGSTYYGVYGYGGTYGVYGYYDGTNYGYIASNGVGVYGISNGKGGEFRGAGTGTNNYGVLAQANGVGGTNHYGIYAEAANSATNSYGVYGKASGGTSKNYAGYFEGNVSSNTDFCIDGGNCLSGVGTGTMSSWTIAGDDDSSTVSNGETATIAGSGTIDTAQNARTVTVSVQTDSIGDTQLEFNTGQHLTTSSSPQFSDLTVAGGDMTMTPEGPDAQIADSFAGNTYKNYISFSPVGGSNDPGAIMHETSTTETNEGVLHLMPSDDNSLGDYVSIHGTDDPDSIRLHTDGTVAGVTNIYDDTAGSSPWLETSSCGDNTYVSSVSAAGTITCAANSATGTVTGSGNSNYVPLWSSSTALTDSAIQQSGGNIGIGASPTYDLDVYAASGDQTIGVWNAARGIVLHAQHPESNYPTIQSIGSEDLYFYAGNSNNQDYYFNSTGKMGIGTTTPNSKLSVGGSGIANAGVYGTAGSYGVYGSASSTGVYGTGATTGVFGCDSDNCANAYGLLGQGNTGVYGSGPAIGVEGCDSDDCSNRYGNLGSNLYGAYGQYDIYHKGYLGGSDRGVYGQGNTYGVYGYSPSGQAGYFEGNATVTDMLRVNGGIAYYGPYTIGLSAGDGSKNLGGFFNGSIIGVYGTIDKTVAESNNVGVGIGASSDNALTDASGTVKGELASLDSGGFGWMGIFAKFNGAEVEAFLANGSVAVYGDQGSGDWAGLFKGDINVTNDIFYGGDITGYGADFAERMPVSSDVNIGDVVCLDEQMKVKKCDSRASPSVAGVVSDNPTIIGNGGVEGVAVGIVGIVPTKVKGPVQRFDMLTTSTEPGHAEKADINDFGSIIGKAMEPCEKDYCTIKVLIGLR